MTLRGFASLAFALLLTATGGNAVAQTNDTPVVQAFDHAIRNVCGPNVAGRLPFDLMNADLNAAHVVLVDIDGDHATQAAFHDWTGGSVAYGFVPAASGRVNLGVDPDLAWCRVAALDVSPAEVSSMQADLEALADWSETGVVGVETTQYLATLDGDVVFVRVTRPGAGSFWGPHTGLIVTVINPAAQEN